MRLCPASPPRFLSGEGLVCAQPQGKGTLGRGGQSWAAPGLPRCLRVRHSLQHGLGTSVLGEAIALTPHAHCVLGPHCTPHLVPLPGVCACVLGRDAGWEPGGGMLFLSWGRCWG